MVAKPKSMVGRVGLEPTTALGTRFTVGGDTNYAVPTHISAPILWRGCRHRRFFLFLKCSSLRSHSLMCGFHATSKTTNPWRPVEASADSVHGASP